MRNAQGFTLIELMVSLVIAALLAAAAIPMATSWASSSRQMEAKNLFAQGVGHARSLAVLNPEGVSGGQAVSVLRVRNNTYQVVNSSSATVVWSAAVPRGVELGSKTAQFGCLQFDNRGLILAGNSCWTASTVPLSAPHVEPLSASTL